MENVNANTAKKGKLLILLFLLLIGSLSVNAALRDDLRNCWDFSSSSGTTVVDKISGNNIRLLNTPSYKTDFLLGAARFNGVNQYGIASDIDNAVLGNHGFTIAAWIKENSSATDQPLIANEALKANRGFYMQQDAAGSITVRAYNNSGTAFNRAIGYASTTYRLLILTYNGTGTVMNAYVNTTGIGQLAMSRYGNSNSSFLVGRRNATADYSNFIVAQIAFWNKTVPQTERIDLYNSGSGRVCQYIGQLNKSVTVKPILNLTPRQGMKSTRFIINTTNYATSLVNTNVNWSINGVNILSGVNQTDLICSTTNACQGGKLLKVQLRMENATAVSSWSSPVYLNISTKTVHIARSLMTGRTVGNISLKLNNTLNKSVDKTIFSSGNNITIWQNYTRGNFTTNITQYYGNARLEKNYTINTRNGTATYNITYNLLIMNTLTVFIRDERDGSLITDTNVTIDAQSYANQTTRTTQLGFVNMTILANTDYNITATSATNYSQRTMIVNVPDEPSATITFYLAPATTTESVVVYAEDDKKAILPNTLISVWRMVNGSAHLIAQRKTDVTGGALFNLVADVTYQVYADKAGYYANPADYQVKSEPNCGALIFGCFKMTLVPASSVVFQDKSGINFGSNLPPSMDAREGFNLTITVSSATNTFSEWGYTAYLNDTNISTTTQTTAAGGSYTRKLNLSNRTGVRLVVYVGYITTNNITGERYFETWINTYALTTQERDNSLVGSFQNSGLSTGAGILLSVLIALTVGIFFQKETNNQNDILLGFILMSVLGVCTYLSLMPLLAFIPAAVLIVMGSVVLSANIEGL